MTPEMRVTFVLGPRETAEELDQALRILLRALQDVNVAYLRRHPHTPSIYRAGVRYEAEPIGQEDWQDIPTLLRAKLGDCEDLASARAAELVVGHDVGAKTDITKRTVHGPIGKIDVIHVIVRWPDGHIEDPSKKLGMGPGGGI